MYMCIDLTYVLRFFCWISNWYDIVVFLVFDVIP